MCESAEQAACAGVQARASVQPAPRPGDVNRHERSFSDASEVCDRSSTIRSEDGVKSPMLVGAVILALIAGWTDLRSRRIPNWLTVPGAVLGLAGSAALGGWSGLKSSVL